MSGDGGEKRERWTFEHAGKLIMGEMLVTFIRGPKRKRNVLTCGSKMPQI